MSYLPLLEYRIKIKLKIFTGEKILYILSEYDFFYLFTVGFVKIIPSRFKWKKYSSPIGFNANFGIQYFKI